MQFANITTVIQHVIFLTGKIQKMNHTLPACINSCKHITWIFTRKIARCLLQFRKRGEPIRWFTRATKAMQQLKENKFSHSYPSVATAHQLLLQALGQRPLRHTDSHTSSARESYIHFQQQIKHHNRKKSYYDIKANSKECFNRCCPFTYCIN